MTDALDLPELRAMHAALRREMVHLDRITVRAHVDVRMTLSGAAGWQLFKRALRFHRASGDATLWPVLRGHLLHRPMELALLEAIEAEHEAVESLTEAVDAATADPDADPVRLADLVDCLVTGLTGHLKHEEDAVLPLAQQMLAVQVWEGFVEDGAKRIGLAAPRLLPWLLDGADADTTASVLEGLPEATREAYAAEWLPAYAALDRWSAESTS